jgi:hypothetical protein
MATQTGQGRGDNTVKVPTIAELRNLSDEELVRRHDSLVNANPGGIEDNVNYYLNELARRRGDVANERMTKLTVDIHRMTIAITVMTFLALAATIVGLFRR